MNTPQKFFGFILLPVLTFILGFSFASEYQKASKGPSLSSRPDKSIHNTAEEIDLKSFQMALESWEEHAERSEDENIEKFKASLKKTERLVQSLKKLDLDILWETIGVLEEKYVEPEKIDFLKMAEGAIKGVVFSVGDPYSTYLTAEESKDFNDDLAGELEGVGAELTMKNGFVTVVSPLKNSPASKGGILPEDVIIQVNDEDITNKSLGEVVKKIRGPRGTSVSLTLLRRNVPDPIVVEIVRQKIIVESVSLEMNDDIAVLEVNQFGDRTEKEFEKHVRDLITKNPKGVVLDLRFNPGGYLETAIALVSIFVKEGKVVVQKERAPSVVNKYVYDGKALTDLPLVVLINKGSASAAEIVAGALQDHERALVVGEQSFGKGTVQEIIPLSDGSNVRLTVAKWLTPEGRDISEVGITPDIVIERTPEDFENDLDPQMETALKILREAQTLEDLKGNEN